MNEQFAETGHGRMAFHDTGGQGVPVVLIHANSVSKESFVPQIAALEKTCRVIAIDLPGHGASSNAVDPRQTYSIPGYAAALLELLASMGVGEFAAIGHSLGGHVALEMVALGGPVRAALVFGTPPISNDMDGLQAGFLPSPKMAYTGNAELSDEQVAMVVSVALGEEAKDDPFFLSAVRRTDGLAREYMIEAVVAGQGSNQRQLVETSAVTLCIVNGADDPLINLDYIDSLACASLWKGGAIRVAGAGHGVHREKPEEFNAILLEFLADHKA